MDEVVNNKNVPHETSSQMPVKPYLNTPVNCPWTSKAPLTSSNICRIGIVSSEGGKCPYEVYHSKQHNDTCTNIADGCGKRQSESNENSSTQFFHFLRLMQLFPDVHPATLHTVMTLCRNDFFSTVDKLLYAKRCKELITNRRNLLLMNKGKMRHQPYAHNSKADEDPKVSLSYKKDNIANSEQFPNNQRILTMCNAQIPCKVIDLKQPMHRYTTEAAESRNGVLNSDLTFGTSPQMEFTAKFRPPTSDTVEDLTKQSNIKNIG